MKFSEPKLWDLCRDCEHHSEDCEKVEVEEKTDPKRKLLTLKCKKYSRN